MLNQAWITTMRSKYRIPSYIEISVHTQLFSIAGDRLRGVCMPYPNRTAVIQIKLLSEEHEMESVLVHELTHAVQWLMSLTDSFIEIGIFPDEIKLSVKEKLEALRDFYPPHVIAQESEAFAMQEVFETNPVLVSEFFVKCFTSLPRYSKEIYDILAEMSINGFFAGIDRSSFIENHGGAIEVIQSYYYTPWGVLKHTDTLLAHINRIARTDVINKEVRKEYGINEASTYAYHKCVLYWAEKYN